MARAFFNEENRTCLEIKREGGRVRYIRATKSKLKLFSMDETGFDKSWVPVNCSNKKALDHFVQLAKDRGATDEVLKLLNITPTPTEEIEEPEMAQDEKNKKPSAANRFRELIMAGKLTDDEIFEKVQKEFDLDSSKRSYVSWYRSNMKKKGLNPPEKVKKK